MKEQIKNKPEDLKSVTCSFCHSDDARWLCTYEDVTIVKCRSCGFIYRNPRLKNDVTYEFYKRQYYDDYKEIEGLISGSRKELFRKALRELDSRLYSPSRKILDIGCGQGHFLKIARDSGWHCAGVELAPSACQFAKDIFGIEIINKSIEETRVILKVTEYLSENFQKKAHGLFFFSCSPL